jgi:hypothetical protein
MLVIKEAN